MENLLTAAAGRVFDEQGWPSPSEESWRRTPLNKLLPEGFLDEAAQVKLSETLPPQKEERSGQTAALQGAAARIITEGGIVREVQVAPQAAAAGLSVKWVPLEEWPSDLVHCGMGELEKNANRIVAWHWRSLSGSVLVHVPSGCNVDGCVLVEERLENYSENPVSIPHLHIDAEESSSVEVCWAFQGHPEGARVSSSSRRLVVNAGMSVRAGANARVGISQNQFLNAGTVCFIHSRLHTDRDTVLNFREFHMGASLVKTRTEVVIASEGADVKLKGAYIARKGDHIDLETIQKHRTPRAVSDALYKGVLMPGARTVFSGLIEVSPQAQGTDAYLTNNNLILGDGARADSIPRLDILTDDVKCSHGSTSGKLEEEHLFYLQSRGYPLSEARKELSKGFLAAVIDDAPSAVQDVLKPRLDEALQQWADE